MQSELLKHDNAMMREQAKREERTARKENEVINKLGYKGAFMAVSKLLCDYDKEIIYDSILKDNQEKRGK